MFSLKVRSRTPEGTLGIELGAFTLSLHPVQAYTLEEAQALTESSSLSPVRQARLLALSANYRDAVRVVLSPSVVGLAHTTEHGHVCCMQTHITSSTKNIADEDRTACNVVKKILDSQLLDDARLMPQANVRSAFKAAIIALKGWMVLGKVLTMASMEAAERNHKPQIQKWVCQKPALA